MACSSNTINLLRRYGEISPENKAKLELWLEEAIESMATNQGGQVSSASANGASFSLRPDGMTNAEWAGALDRALQMIELGLKSTKTAYGNIF